MQVSIKISEPEPRYVFVGGGADWMLDYPQILLGLGIATAVAIAGFFSWPIMLVALALMLMAGAWFVSDVEEEIGYTFIFATLLIGFAWLLVGLPITVVMMFALFLIALTLDVAS